MNTEVMFSSATPEWETPQDLFDRLNAEFRFTLDVCATAENAKCEFWYEREDDGLASPWDHGPGDTGAAWMNPPYGRGIYQWVAKANQTGVNGRTVVCLLPARTDTRWWHDFIWCADLNAPYTGVEVRFIKGRLKFGNSKNAAPFPSVVVVFR